MKRIAVGLLVGLALVACQPESVPNVQEDSGRWNCAVMGNQYCSNTNVAAAAQEAEFLYGVECVASADPAYYNNGVPIWKMECD